MADLNYSKVAKRGLSKELIVEMSKDKGEPSWMTEIRLDALAKFYKLALPKWAEERLPQIDYDSITYYAKATDREATTWEDVPKKIKETFDKLGVPKAEKEVLAGLSAQYESNVLYNSIIESLEKEGVVFTSMDKALKEHSDIVREHFSKLVPANDNKFAALNTALWSGGSFLYVPRGVKVKRPLQAYFRINMEGFGQFERTLIVAEEGAEVSYIEGCTAPSYSRDSLHAAVVEVFAKKGSRVRYTTVQNWSKNVLNLVTKRSIAYENAYIEWLDGNLGSKVTMKYPAVILAGKGARGKIISIAYAGSGQLIDSGAKAIHTAPNTSSTIISKSISSGGGNASYRGWVSVAKNATNSKIDVNCDALLMDGKSRTDTYPYIDVRNKKAVMSHEASVGKISEEQLFYLMNRGIKEEDARTMLVMGFLEEFTKEVPLEYAVELNRLIGMEMEGSVG
ncbi:MAG: Fe-S cluster assembly protein SufB [Methanobacteriota archaeon]|nr:MAG: Fe-S cluster assembly protein SufB [Euryarchaeota archaeon]